MVEMLMGLESIVVVEASMCNVNRTYRVLCDRHICVDMVSLKDVDWLFNVFGIPIVVVYSSPSNNVTVSVITCPGKDIIIGKLKLRRSKLTGSVTTVPDRHVV